MTPGFVKKNIVEADRRFWPKALKHRVRGDIACVMASPLVGRQGQVLGTVSFDSNLPLDEMRWNQRGIEAVLEWTARAVVLVLGVQPER